MKIRDSALRPAPKFHQELRELSQQQSDELRQKSARLEEVEGIHRRWC